MNLLYFTRDAYKTRWQELQDGKLKNFENPFQDKHNDRPGRPQIA